MSNFVEGQEVEVLVSKYPEPPSSTNSDWCKAKIIRYYLNNTFEVQFPDGTRAVFDADHIRAAETKRETWPGIDPYTYKP